MTKPSRIRSVIADTVHLWNFSKCKILWYTLLCNLGLRVWTLDLLTFIAMVNGHQDLSHLILISYHFK